MCIVLNILLNKNNNIIIITRFFFDYKIILFSFDYNVRVIVITVFAAEQSHTTRILRSTAQHIHPPAERVFALGSEKVDVIFKLQLEYKVFLYGVLLVGSGNTVAE